MPSKRKNGRSEKYTWKGHIQVYFNDHERTEAKTWLDTRNTDLAGSIETISSTLCSLKITSNQNDGTYQFTLQPKEKQSPYYGYTLGFSHVELLRGVAIMEYISEVLMETNYIEIPDHSNIPDW